MCCVVLVPQSHESFLGYRRECSFAAITVSNPVLFSFSDNCIDLWKRPLVVSYTRVPWKEVVSSHVLSLEQELSSSSSPGFEGCHL